MSPAEFVAMQGVTPRVFKAPPEVTATCTPEIAAFIDPAGTLQDAGLVIPRHAFGPIVPTLDTLIARELAAGKDAAQAQVRAQSRLEELQQTFPDSIEDPVKLARFKRAQSLTGAKLAAMVPAWAKHKPIQPFTPDLSQRIPHVPCTVLSNDAHRAWLFKRFLCQPIAKMGTAQYVAAWDLANSFKA